MSDFLKNIIDRLIRVAKRKNAIKAYEGFFRFLTLLSASVLFFSFIESLFHFNSGIRTIFVLFFLLINIAAFIYFVVLPAVKNLPFFFKLNEHQLAVEVGNNFPGIKDKLVNAIQLIEDKASNYSPELVQAAFKEVYNKTKDLDFGSYVRFKKVKLRNSALALSAATLFILIFMPQINSAFIRLTNYNKEFIEPPKYSFTIFPGNKEITKGDDVEIKISVEGDLPRFISFFSKSKEDPEFVSKQLYPDSNGIFYNKLSSLNNSIKYYAEAEDAESAVYEIKVVDRPVIRKLVLNIRPPAYSGLPQTEQVDNGSASVLPGTVVEFDVSSTKILSQADLIYNDSNKVEFNVNGDMATGKINVFDEMDYYISVSDTGGVKNEHPIMYNISALTDQAPSVEIVEPGKNIQLGLENALPLTVEIDDDYGFSSLKLFYQISSSSYRQYDDRLKSIDLSFLKNKTEQEVYHTWNLTPLSLKAEDVVSYYVEVADNDNVNGPKKDKSKVYTIRIPSLNELFAQADETQQSAENDLEQTLKEAKELGEEMQRINDELKKDQREITWEEKEKIEKSIEKFESLQKNVEDVQKKLDEMRKELTSNELLSEETLNKYNELQELMDQLTGEEMKNALKKMQEQLQSMLRNQAQNQMAEMQFSEEAFKKSIERTLNLLKRIQVEQKMDELIKRTEEMTKQLDELSKETEESDLSEENKNEELSEKQESLGGEFDKIEKEMNELKDKMSELEDMPVEEAEKLMEEMKKQGNKELNEKASEQLKKMQKSQAMASQQQMQQNMQQMMNQMQQMQQQMQQQNQMKVMGEMVKIVEDLIQLSKEQEELKNKTANLPQNSHELREAAQKQNSLQQNLDKVTRRMSELAQKTFGITPEMGRAIGNARREMSQSINNMQNINGTIASQNQQRAMKGLNEAAMLMKNSLNMMMSGGSGGGMMSMMQQLQKMSQQQMNLNQLTQMMNQGKLSQQQMAQMQRLAQEQAMIQKSLQELNNEAKAAGESKKLGANLEKILEEMQEVVTDMKSNNIDDDLVQKQERILSKMLDAQRSINERDFEKERESFTGENVRRESPPELMLSTEEGRDKLRDELLNSAKEGYSKDYRELIRKYFEALQKQKLKN